MSIMSNPTKLLLQVLWVESSRVELRWVLTIIFFSSHGRVLEELSLLKINGTINLFFCNTILI